jgi:four helix bundle protein
MAIKSFRDLRVWQAAMDLVVEVYELTADLPKSEEFGLKSQMRRAVISVPSNIAEGHTREHTGDYLHHLSIANGSLGEMVTQLEACIRLKYLFVERTDATMSHMASLAKQLYALRNSLKRPSRP